ncbi:MAG: protease-like activity factor CPAF, partial [Parachlamydiaceae bacterium]|nr:protease-like activity factor CPAF [Parachlamydiaceae bacterium]
EWKKDYAAWSLDEEIDLAKAKIESSENMTVHDYQRILHSFFISTRDYHVSNEYYSTEMALLPFEVKSAEGHYIITDASNNYFQEMASLGLYRGSKIPSIGDELLMFDGKPIDEAISQLKNDELGNPSSKTSQVLAEGVLTQRLRSIGHQVPHGTIHLQFKKMTGEVITAEMEWVYSPEKIANKSLSSFKVMTAAAMNMFGFAESIEYKESPDLAPVVPERYKTMVINPVANALSKDRSKVYEEFFAQAGKDAYNSQDQAERGIPTPSLDRGLLTLGTKIWQESASSHFKAYIYRSPLTQKRVGYVRISTYQPTDNYNNVTTFAMQLASVLRYFETSTDALVIDQVDNPGGIFLYAYAILSMLTDHPLIALQHQATITQEDVAQAFKDIEQITYELQMGASVSLMLGYPVTPEFLLGQLSYSEFIISEWEAGNTLTGNRPVQGIDIIDPHPQAHYSKPIVILVDSRDFSCADIVPAILQDNGRALVFGAQTAGAGGIVKQHSYPNLFGLANFSYTASIFERQNGTRLENLGVTPDMPYELTKDDLLYGYKGYIQAVNKAIELQMAK